MPITKDVSGVITYTERKPLDTTEGKDTGVVRESDFAVCGDNDITRQFKVDLTDADPSAVIKLKAAAGTTGEIVLTLPTESGSIGGGGGSGIPADGSVSINTGTDSLNFDIKNGRGGGLDINSTSQVASGTALLKVGARTQSDVEFGWTQTTVSDMAYYDEPQDLKTVVETWDQTTTNEYMLVAGKLSVHGSQGGIELWKADPDGTWTTTRYAELKESSGGLEITASATKLTGSLLQTVQVHDVSVSGTSITIAASTDKLVVIGADDTSSYTLNLPAGVVGKTIEVMTDVTWVGVVLAPSGAETAYQDPPLPNYPSVTGFKITYVSAAIGWFGHR
jgi:hypothetical protein